MAKKSGNYDLVEWSRTMASVNSPGSQEESYQEIERVHESVEEHSEFFPDDIPEIETKEEEFDMEMALPGTADEVEALIKRKAAEYRDRHYPGVDAQRVRWNKEGSEEVIDIVKRAVKEVPGVNKRALAEAVGTTYLTLGKWLAGGKEDKKVAVASAAPKSPRPTPVIQTKPERLELNPPIQGNGHDKVEKADDDDQLCFDIEKVRDGRLRVWLNPKGLKAFINNL